MFVFQKFGVLCFLETPVLRFALLLYYRRIRYYDRWQYYKRHVYRNYWQHVKRTNTISGLSETFTIMNIIISDSNHPVLLYRTAKTNKFVKIDLLYHTWTLTYTATKNKSDYLRCLRKNEYSIHCTQKFPTMLSSILSLWDDEDVSFLQDFPYRNPSLPNKIFHPPIRGIRPTI